MSVYVTNLPDSSVVLLDDNADRRRDFATILEFLGEQPVAHRRSEWAAVFSTWPKALPRLVIVDTDGDFPDNLLPPYTRLTPRRR